MNLLSGCLMDGLWSRKLETVVDKLERNLRYEPQNSLSLFIYLTPLSFSIFCSILLLGHILS